jgi:hypothetical protein
MTKQYSIPFIKNGEPFEMTNWTVRKHEELLENMIPYDEQLSAEKITQKEYDRQYRLRMILLSMREIDPKVEEKNLLELHPDDFIELWIACYNSGKRGIKKDNQDFQNGEKTPK